MLIHQLPQIWAKDAMLPKLPVYEPDLRFRLRDNADPDSDTVSWLKIRPPRHPAGNRLLCCLEGIRVKFTAEKRKPFSDGGLGVWAFMQGPKCVLLMTYSLMFGMSEITF